MAAIGSKDRTQVFKPEYVLELFASARNRRQQLVSVLQLLFARRLLSFGAFMRLLLLWAHLTKSQVRCQAALGLAWAVAVWASNALPVVVVKVVGAQKVIDEFGVKVVASLPGVGVGAVTLPPYQELTV